MPLRRRPSEPSPRLRALLEGTRAAGGGEVLATQSTSVGPAAGSEPPGGAPAVVVPWVPERAWLELPQREPPSSHAQEGPVGGRPGRHRRPRPPGPRFLTVPESLRGARLTAPRLAAVGLLLVLAVAAVGFGARVAWARAASEPRVVAPAQHGSAVSARGASAAGFTSGPGARPAASGAAASGAAGTAASSAAGPGAGSAAGSAPGGAVTVHVVGQVRHPGVLRLPPGSRVADAVDKAGGATTHANLSAVNLARPLVDGEQVRIPRPGEQVAAAQSGGPGAAGAGGAAGGGDAGGPVNLNTASQAQLEELPGVGPVLAQRIIEWRTEHGRFTTVDELGEVSGVGEKTFAQLQPKVSV